MYIVPSRRSSYSVASRCRRCSFEFCSRGLCAIPPVLTFKALMIWRRRCCSSFSLLQFRESSNVIQTFNCSKREVLKRTKRLWWRQRRRWPIIVLNTLNSLSKTSCHWVLKNSWPLRLTLSGVLLSLWTIFRTTIRTCSPVFTKWSTRWKLSLNK